MKKIDPVVHFEMPAEDRRRVADFYSKVFGWEAQMLGEEMGNYITVTTSETDENGRPKMPGTINGGFYPKNENVSNHPSVVVAVDDIKESIRKIKEAKGKILGEPSEIPGIGLYVSFTDTEGNTNSRVQSRFSFQRFMEEGFKNTFPGNRQGRKDGRYGKQDK